MNEDLDVEESKETAEGAIFVKIEGIKGDVTTKDGGDAELKLASDDEDDSAAGIRMEMLNNKYPKNM